MTKPTAVAYLVGVATVALVGGLYAAGGAWHPALTGLPDAGQVITWALRATQLIGLILGLRIIGLLIAATFVLPTTQDTILKESIATVRSAATLAAVWAVTGITTGILTLAVALGLTASQVATPGIVGTYLWSLPAARNYVLAAALAALIAIAAPVVASLNSMLGLIVIAAAGIAMPLLGSHSASLGDHSLAVTSSTIHGLAASIWIGTLWAVLPTMTSQPVRRRFGWLAHRCFIALALSGVGAAYARLDSIRDLLNSGYGRTVLVKILLLVALAALAVLLRRAAQQTRLRLVAIELTLMAAASGLGSALHVSPFSRDAILLPSAAEELLGFPFPPAPTATLMLTGWHPEWLILTLCVVLGTSYLRASRRSHWPLVRTLSFISGMLLVAWATSSNLAKYAMLSFTQHMIQHMTLSMLAPILIVLGAPITLALRSLPAVSEGHARSPRRWLSSLLTSRYLRVLTHPLVVLGIFIISLYGVYFTPVFADLMSSHTGHLAMELHFLAAGYLFAFTVVGIDPAPRQLPHWGRVIMVLVAMSVHAFFAISLMQATVPIGARWYSQVRPPWIENPLTDTYGGAGMAWAIGEIPTLVLLIVVAVQWARSDARLAARLDREADRSGDADLAAYNARLAGLDRSDRAT